MLCPNEKDLPLGRSPEDFEFWKALTLPMFALTPPGEFLSFWRSREFSASSEAVPALPLPRRTCRAPKPASLLLGPGLTNGLSGICDRVGILDEF
jgi:hypothetical protein